MTRDSSNLDIYKRVLKNVPFFSRFNEQEISAFFERTSVYSCHKNEIIIQANDYIVNMYIVLKGRVKVVYFSVDGEERVMAIRNRGDYFGDMGFLDGKTDSATVIAMEHCKILLVAKSVFDMFVMGNIKGLNQIISILCARLRESWIFQDLIGNDNAESKIRATLAHYSKKLGKRDSTGVIINFLISQQSIADRVHIKRETASRILTKMKNQNEIEMVGHYYKLLPGFLRISSNQVFSGSMHSKPNISQLLPVRSLHCSLRL